MTTSLITVRVTFDDGNQIVTSINATLAEAKLDYLDNRFELAEGKLSRAVAEVQINAPEPPAPPAPRQRYLLVNSEGYLLSCWETRHEAYRKAAGRAISVKEVVEPAGIVLFCVYDTEGAFHGWSENPKWALDFVASDPDKYRFVVLVEKR